MRQQTNGGQDNHAARPVGAAEPTDLGGDVSCGINQRQPVTSGAATTNDCDTPHSYEPQRWQWSSRRSCVHLRERMSPLAAEF